MRSLLKQVGAPHPVEASTYRPCRARRPEDSRLRFQAQIAAATRHSLVVCSTFPGLALRTASLTKMMLPTATQALTIPLRGRCRQQTHLAAAPSLRRGSPTRLLTTSLARKPYGSSMWIPTAPVLARLSAKAQVRDLSPTPQLEIRCSVCRATLLETFMPQWVRLFHPAVASMELQTLTRT